eukprot:5177039-Pyramimonas_sp.AAC.1
MCIRDRLSPVLSCQLALIACARAPCHPPPPCPPHVPHVPPDPLVHRRAAAVPHRFSSYDA